MDPFSQCSSSLPAQQNRRKPPSVWPTWSFMAAGKTLATIHDSAAWGCKETRTLWGGLSVFRLFTAPCFPPPSFLCPAARFKQLHVCFLPFVPRCQNIITTVLKWNKRTATLRITAQKQRLDGKKKTPHPVGHAVNLLPEQSVCSVHTQGQIWVPAV